MRSGKNLNKVNEFQPGRGTDIIVAIEVFGLKVNDGISCGHPGCIHHVTHACEGCGRIHPSLVPEYSFNTEGMLMILDHMVGKESLGSEFAKWFRSYLMRNAIVFWKMQPIDACRAALYAKQKQNGEYGKPIRANRRI